MCDEEWTTVTKKKNRQRKSSGIPSSPFELSPLMSKTTVSNSQIDDINTLYVCYNKLEKEIKENETKMMKCLNEKLCDYLISRNKDLSQQHSVLVQGIQEFHSKHWLSEKIHNIEHHIRKIRISKAKELDI